MQVALSAIDTLVNDDVIIPTGFVIGFANTTNIPNGWLLCNNQAVSRSVYSKLFLAIGTTWGAGDGSTTFHLPDMRGRVPMGNNPTAFSGISARTIGNKVGSETVTLSTAQLPSHTHTGTLNSAGEHRHGFYVPRGDRNWDNGFGNVHWGANTRGSTYTSTAGSHTHTLTLNNTGSGTGHANIQPCTILSYIVKT